MVFTASSTLSVISVSTSCGDAPGFTTVTVIVGKSILGNRSTPSDRNENAPTTTSDMMSIVAKTGRFTQTSASHCISVRPHENSILQLAEAACGDNLALLHALFDLDHIPLEQADLYEPFVGDAVFDDKDLVYIALALNRGSRDHNRVL